MAAGFSCAKISATYQEKYPKNLKIINAFVIIISGIT